MVKYYKKTTYSYSKRGKYYTNRHVTNLIRNWGKYKLSISFFLTKKVVDSHYEFHMDGLDSGQTQLHTGDLLGIALRHCNYFDQLQTEWTFWKCTGICFEVEPITGNVSTNLYNGSVAFGVSTEQILPAQNNSYAKVIESDKAFILDIKNAMRKYYPVRTTDYQIFENNNAVPRLPYRVAIGWKEFGEVPENTVWPKWVIKMTFYLTCKDKIL